MDYNNRNNQNNYNGFAPNQNNLNNGYGMPNQGNMYYYNGYGCPVVPTSGLAVASMVLGIIALLCSFCIAPVAIVCALLAIIFGVAKDPSKGGDGMAATGIICGILSLIPAIYILYSGFAIINAFNDFVS